MSAAAVTSATMSAPATVMSPTVMSPAVMSLAVIAATVVTATTVVVAVMMMPVAEAKEAKPANQSGTIKGIRVGIGAAVTEAIRIGICVWLIIGSDRQHPVAARGHALRVAELIRNFGLCGGGDFVGCCAGTRTGRRRTSTRGGGPAPASDGCPAGSDARP